MSACLQQTSLTAAQPNGPNNIVQYLFIIIHIVNEEDHHMAEAMNAEHVLSALKKPLDKMTVKELKDLAIAKIPQIVGASGMHKEDLLAAIKENLGIVEEEGGGSPYAQQLKTMKTKIMDLKARKNEIPKTKRMERKKLRQQIHELKKKTRRLAVV